MPTVWKNDDLFEHHYCSRFPGKLLYSTFDYATQDADGTGLSGYFDACQRVALAGRSLEMVFNDRAAASQDPGHQESRPAA